MGKKLDDIAKDAAVAYFGLSSSENSFPKGTEVTYHKKVDIEPDTSGFFTDLKERIDKIWTENIGNMSRVARMSDVDFTHYVNQLRTDRGAKPLNTDSNLIEMWMKMMTSADRKLILVEIKSSEGRKLLLVNTGIRM